MKIGFIIDSSTGITKKESDALGYGYLPLPVSINGKNYLDGVDITSEELYKIISPSDDVKTSATPPKLITDIYKEYSKKYDHVIVYGVSKKLSSQTSNLKIFSREFENIHVVDSKLLTYAIIQSIESAKKFIKEKNVKDINKIMDFLNEDSGQWVGFLIPKRLDWLVKGGRVGPKIATMANLLKIIPIIKFADGELIKHGKGKVFAKSFIKITKKIKHISSTGKFIIFKGNQEYFLDIIKDAKSVLGKDVVVRNMPVAIALHAGEESILVITRK